MKAENISHLYLQERHGPAQDLGLNADTLISVSSWEPRCTEILKAPFTALSGVVLRFGEMGQSGRRLIHDDLLMMVLNRRVARLSELPMYSAFNYQAWKDALSIFLIEEYRSLARRLHVVIDASCCPKAIILYVIGFCLKTGLAYRVSIFYSEGNYAVPEGSVDSIDRYSFTEGDWRSNLVPYLEGSVRPERKIRLIVSSGFETFQARTFIRSFEADAIELIVAFPGFLSDYDEMAERESEALINSLDVPREHVVRCHAGRPLLVANRVLALAANSPWYDIALSLGTKPHAIGLAMAALVNSRITVVCRRPAAYVESNTTATGHCWLYDIFDRSSGVAMSEAVAHSSDGA